MRQLSHDGFARRSTVSRKERTSHSCEWCGQQHIDGKLTRYGTQADDSLSGRVNWDKHLFCCKSCRDSYHND